ncbi:putative sh3 domain containing protein [Erysiphe necator]|uniref:Putative sh3 domain containing protein n=1 Tax=Uncinula necator TaxID=52586 RepID=A0A0B1PI32_UNCNE|nr:putative sh3 domain containing protein [Erysiphe necator]
MNRQFGRLMRKDPGNRADIATLLSDYEEADKALSKMIEAFKSWRDSWVSTLSIQVAATALFKDLYNPITSGSDRHDAVPTVTPIEKLKKVVHLQEIFSDLKSDLLSEVKMIESRVIKPAIEVKEFIQPAKKSIRKRENKRLDLEMYTSRVNNYTKKMKRTERENVALAKAEEEVAEAACSFKLADDHLRDILPPIISSALSILPHLLRVQIMIQTTLLAHSYTALHEYCEEANFPFPSPSMPDVIKVWATEFNPIRKRVEAISCIARGKSVHQFIALEDDGSIIKSQIARNGIQDRRPSNNAIVSSQQSTSILGTINQHVPSHPEKPRNYSISNQNQHIESEPVRYDSNDMPHQNTTNSFNSLNFPVAVNNEQPQRSLVGKKRPPPPPPPKRKLSKEPQIYVTALYSFDGENDGDLSFKDGDIIMVTKKTNSTDDWWEGILRGQQGNFPANYCQIN